MSIPSLIFPLELLYTTVFAEEGYNSQQQQQQQHSSSSCHYVDVHLEDAIVFRCPQSIFRECSEFISEHIENDLEDKTEMSSKEITLASVNSTLFRTVIIYLEHFYASVDLRSSGKNDSAESSSHSGQPTLLSRPLQVRELYHLSDWEHRFVVQQLLQWPQEKWGLCEEGQWVDASVTKAFTQSIETCEISHLLGVLEVATKLGVQPLKELCGAVIANFLLDLDEKHILEFMDVKKTFDSEEEKALLEEYPWLNV
ncbi:uncharacterized protein TM35_000053880 [Trypanosoma theileri]|uniref:SKP1 component dimerisation domain-containing protein n=1 Tax=Trypanosoma theileri TaxID=67003 RepID=A0A1X0P4E3_9TRYP|nr:uncharacterized protein TM35_000053880 [Trypanosoma theileri]ORC91792.1 hypothetical protein TM35_000053880 [Trypanosoma theileri]